MAQLIFNVKNQWIRREDSFKPVAKSKNYLYAKFKFLSEEWTGTPTALFSDSQNTYTVLIDQNGECLVPWEVIHGDERNFTVSVFCGDLVTANKLKIRLYESGYTDDAESETPPTPSVYNQIIERMDGVEQTVVDSAEAAAGSASSASASAGAAAGSAAQAAESASAAGTSAQAALSAASSAGQKATAAAGSASESASKASEAAASATAAAGSASAAAASAGEAATKAGEAASSATEGINAKNAAISAKNDAVNAKLAAETAVEHYPRIVNDYWQLWDPEDEEWVDTGVKAEGTDGLNGYSPTVTVTEITGGHRVVITDKNGSHTFDVMDGSDATVTVDDELDDQSENPVQNKVITEEVLDLKAKISHKQDAPSMLGTDGQIMGLAEINGQLVPVWINPLDVKINGTSIVNQGVAEIPIATQSVYGLMKPGNGLTIINDLIVTNRPDDSLIKAGTNGYRPLTPTNQHASTFYGLAKAASDTTQSASSNAVGTYTDAAKVAIQKMLGIYEAPWELIREDTFTNAISADHVITVDGNGQAFELTDVILMFETPVQSTESAKGNYGNLEFWDGSTIKARTYNTAWTQQANASAHGIWTMIEQRNGLVFVTAKNQTTSINMATLVMPYQAGMGNTELQGIHPSNNFIVNKVNITAVTGTGHYKLYGKRKWS